MRNMQLLGTMGLISIALGLVYITGVELWGWLFG